MRPVWLRPAIAAIAAGMLALPGASAAAAASATSGTPDGSGAADPCPQLVPEAAGRGGASETERVTDVCVYPVIGLSADPSAVEYGGWSTIHWSVENAMHGCTNWSNPSTNFGGITGAGERVGGGRPAVCEHDVPRPL